MRSGEPLFLENLMSIADDLTRLEQLRDRGSLNADEFQRAKNKLLCDPRPTEPVLQAVNGLRRSATDRWLGGVCGGLASATGMEAWLWRIVFVMALCTGFGLLAYLVLWIFVPLEHSVPLARAS
jgi:phage shock protein PspC (stress-responsive transcriptional regulator)